MPFFFAIIGEVLAAILILAMGLPDREPGKGRVARVRGADPMVPAQAYRDVFIASPGTSGLWVYCLLK
jgi:hypothetical protein